MARTTVLTEIDDDLFDELRGSADAMDISVETYAAMRLEQQARQIGRARTGTTTAPRNPVAPQALVLLTGAAAEAAVRSAGHRYRDITRWVSQAVLDQAQREMQPAHEPNGDSPDPDVREPTPAPE